MNLIETDRPAAALLNGISLTTDREDQIAMVSNAMQSVGRRSFIFGAVIGFAGALLVALLICFANHLSLPLG